MQTIISQAEKILTDAFGEPVCLRQAETYTTTKSRVVRCVVTNSPAHLPASFIAKQVKLHLDKGHSAYNPDSADPLNPAHLTFNDWAAAQFLAHLFKDNPIAPRFYGGSRETGLIVLEDLGMSAGLDTLELLKANDPERAATGLLEHVALIGQLHSTTLNQSESYRQIRNRIGPSPTSKGLMRDPWSNALHRPPEKRLIVQLIEAYRATLGIVGITIPAVIAAEIELVVSQVEIDPGPFLAFCQGDQNLPGGCLRSYSKLRLLDFDQSGFRHALLEGLPGRMSWGCIMRIPVKLVAQMEWVYRQELIKNCPQAANDILFYQVLVEAGARWHIFQVLERLPVALKNDRARGPTTLRQQLLAGLETFSTLVEEYGHLKLLGQAAGDLALHLNKIWAGEVKPLPYYPVFQV